MRRRRTTFASGSFRRACQSVDSARQCVCSLALWSALHPAVTGHGPSRKGEGCGAVAKPSRVLRACNRVFLQTSPECVPDTNLRRDELLQIANGVVRIALDAHLCAREQKVTQRAHTPGQRRIHLPSFRACRCTPPQSLCSALRVLPAASSPPLPLLRREGEKKGKEKQYCGKEGSSPLCFRFPSFLSWLGREREREEPVPTSYDADVMVTSCSLSREQCSCQGNIVEPPSSRYFNTNPRSP